LLILFQYKHDYNKIKAGLQINCLMGS